MELHGEDFRTALDLCGEAVVVCEFCAEACSDLNGMHECLRACRDCIALAGICMNFLARGSQLMNPLCTLTAAACDLVASNCEHYTADVFVETASTCRECAEACRLVASGAYIA